MEVKDITPKQAFLLWQLVQESPVLGQAIELLQEKDLLPMNSNSESRNWIAEFLCLWAERYKEHNLDLVILAHAKESPKPKSDFQKAMQ